MFSSVKYLDGEKEQQTSVTRPGRVEAIFQNGDKFEGEFVEGPNGKGLLRSGFGTYLWTSGAAYAGEYEAGKRHGTGKYTFPTGEVYEGLWSKGLKSGKGKYIYTNGDVFYGVWKNDKREGEGSFIMKGSSSEITGVWRKGKLDEQTFQERPLKSKIEEPKPEEPKPVESQPVEEQPQSKPVPEPVVEESKPETPEKQPEPVADTAPTEAERKEEPVPDPTPEPVQDIKEESPATVPEPVQPEEQAPTPAVDPAEESTPAPVVKEEVAPDLAPKSLGVIIAGAPASGKGTQCENIAAEFKLVHISTGDLLRALAVETNTSELAVKTREHMSSGQLVPDEIVLEALKARIEQDDVKKNGFLLDGYPRTEAQAKSLDVLLQSIQVPVDLVMLLSVEEERLVERAVGRRLDPDTGKIYHLKFNPPPEDIVERLVHRSDDNEDTMKQRIELFNQNVKNLEKFYTEKLVVIDGNNNKDQIWDDIKALLLRVKDGEDVHDIVKEETEEKPASGQI